MTRIRGKRTENMDGCLYRERKGSDGYWKKNRPLFIKVLSTSHALDSAFRVVTWVIYHGLNTCMVITNVFSYLSLPTIPDFF